MPITKSKIVGQLTVDELFNISVRYDTIYYDNDVEEQRKFHRALFAPGDDVSQEKKLVRDVAAAIWTPAVIAAAQARAAAAAAAQVTP